MDLIGCAGGTSAGKDLLIERVLLPCRYASIKTSDMLRSAIPAFFGTDFKGDVNKLTPVELNEHGEQIRKVHGQDIFTMLAIHQDGASKKVVNGIRRREEFSAIHRYGGIVILVMCDVEIAVKRALLRRRDIDQSVDEGALRRHILREQDTLNSTRDKADLILVNNFGTVEEFITYAQKELAVLIN